MRTSPGRFAFKAAPYPIPTDERGEMSERRFTLGRVVWRELSTSDVEKARAFYAELFGWTYQEEEPGLGSRGATIQHGGRSLGRIRQQVVRVGSAASKWVSYVSVDNVDASVVIASADGGGAMPGPRDVPGMGRVAMVVDFADAMLAAFRSSHGDPAPAMPEVGGFCWETLITPDVARAKEFYGKVFGWRTQSRGSTGAVFAADSTPSGQVADVQEAPDAPPHWRTYVLVEDLDASRARAAGLGARVPVPLLEIPDVGRIAVLVDPTGAEFGLYEPVRPG
jgi:hypothetical protein